MILSLLMSLVIYGNRYGDLSDHIELNSVTQILKYTEPDGTIVLIQEIAKINQNNSFNRNGRAEKSFLTPLFESRFSRVNFRIQVLKMAVQIRK